MDAKTRIQLAAVVVGSHLSVALAVWAAYQAYQFAKEHVMCICPTAEQPKQKVSTESGLIAELLEKLKEAGTYLELHHPAVAQEIKAMGVDIPAFSFQAPVLVDLRNTLDRLPATLCAMAGK